jgi:hypothetical protein
MRELSPQRKKVVVLGGSLACLSGPGLLLLNTLHGSRYLPTFAILWCVLMVGLMAFTVSQLVKLQRERR